MKNFLKIIAATLIGSLLAMLLGFFIFMGLISSALTFADSKVPVVPSSAVLSINFGQTITEQAVEDPFSSINPLSSSTVKTVGILDFIETIDRAATDPQIKFAYMNLNQLNAGNTHIEEIREALIRFRDSGKAIIAYADNYSQGAYYLASAADKIYLNPSGMSLLNGLSLNTIFLKDLLDKTGVEVQLVRHGKFKAAAEQFISNKMSNENREQLQAYVNSVWATWTEAISLSRDIPIEKINYLADNLKLVTAQDALEAGLVDGLMYKDEMLDNLVKLFGVEKEKDLKMITSNAYSKATKRRDLKQKNKIAVLYANGEIVMGKSKDNIGSDSFQEQIAKIRKDSSIKAVVLRVNSPGGSAQSSEIIERELALLREVKPVVVSMGDYAASGGYWISSNAHKIFTNRSTLTGSIGVFSMIINVQKTMSKHLHINPVSVNTNRHSDFTGALGYRPIDNEEELFMQGAVEKIYTDFINLVSQGRSMTYEKVDEIGQGRIWSGLHSLENGLTDQYGGIKDAIAYAAQIAEIDGWRVVEYPVIKSQMEKLLESLSDIDKSAKIIASPELLFTNAYSYLKSERGLRNFARVPFNIELIY